MEGDFVCWFAFNFFFSPFDSIVGVSKSMWHENSTSCCENAEQTEEHLDVILQANGLQPQLLTLLHTDAT